MEPTPASYAFLVPSRSIPTAALSFASTRSWTGCRSSRLTANSANWHLADRDVVTASSIVRKDWRWTDGPDLRGPTRATIGSRYFPAQGEFLRAYGHAGSGLGQLSYPYDVQIDGAGRDYRL